MTKKQEDLEYETLPVEPDEEISDASDGAEAKATRRRAKTEKARTEPDRPLKEANMSTKVVGESMETHPAAPGEGGTKPRVSFIVRLTVDERGQPGRTEIEHVEGGRKQNFPMLDGESLVAFMMAHIGPTIIPEPAIPAASSLSVSDVRVIRLGTPGATALILSPEEAFVVLARFRLHGSGAPSLTTQESSYEMKVYAIEVTSGKPKLIRTYSDKLSQGVLEYIPQVEVPGLSAGLYRLFTQVTLGAPINMAGYHDKTVIEVK